MGLKSYKVQMLQMFIDLLFGNWSLYGHIIEYKIQDFLYTLVLTATKHNINLSWAYKQHNCSGA